MHLDAEAAKSLAAIILTSTQGADALQSQVPLHAIDRGGTWLIKGTPYSDARRGVQFCFSHVMFRKEDAEVVSIDSDIRPMLTEDEKKYWHQTMSNDEFDRIFGPRTEFEEGGPRLAGRLAVNAAFYGGLINTRQDAFAYAKVIMTQSARVEHVPDIAIGVEERAEVWHVTLTDPHSGNRVELMRFSRMNGKVLWSEL